MVKKIIEPKVEKPTVKIEDKFFAGKRIVKEFEQDGAKFVELEGGETVKL